MEQRFVVNGINNDKIELVSKYDARKLNRLLDAKDKMWLVKIKKARDEINDLDRHFDNDYFSSDGEAMLKCSEVLAILDKLIESEG